MQNVFKDYYYEKFEISKNNDIKLNPDIFYVSLPLYNSSGKISGILNNDERLLFEYNLIDDVDGLKIGKNITIDQIREIGNFASLSSNNNHKIIPIKTDITIGFQVIALFNKIKSDHGRIDLLFNNAGMGAPRVPIEDLKEEDWRKTVDVNLTGSFLC